MSPRKIDAVIAESEAQTQILRALAKLKDPSARERVLQALGYIMTADQLVPGIFAALSRGLWILPETLPETPPHLYQRKRRASKLRLRPCDGCRYSVRLFFRFPNQKSRAGKDRRHSATSTVQCSLPPLCLKGSTYI